jgi:hypothetical protein
MCKNKLNCVNGDYKGIYDYHKGTCHNTSYWHLSMEKHNKFNLPKQFNENCYNVIQTFQREKNINLSIHVRDLNAQRYEVYTTKQKTIRGKFPYAIILLFHARVIRGRQCSSKNS